MSKWKYLFELWKKNSQQDLKAFRDEPLQLIVPLHAISQMVESMLRHTLTLSGQTLYDLDTYCPEPADLLKLFPLDKDIEFIKSYWVLISEWKQCQTGELEEYVDIKIKIAEGIRTSAINVMNMFEDYRTNGGWEDIDKKRASSLLRKAEGNLSVSQRA